MSFISLYFGSTGDIGIHYSLFILIVQTVQDNTEEPTNNYDVVLFVLSRELICYASLIKAPKSH